ncbi:MAG: ROK family protein [Chloroflexota bacterium]|nr:MAG: hypothetical protein DLM70_19725 [Chloroflexota bacterium]
MELANLVIDLGGTQVRTAVFGPDGVPRGRMHERSRLEDGPRGALAQMVRMGRASLQAASVERDRLGRVVVSCPGPLDSRAGVVLDPPNLPGWERVPLKAWLDGAFGVPSRIVNDANVAALGEFTAGAGRGTRNMVYLTISTGIGGGIIVDGELLEGSSGTAGEIGHMTIDLHGPTCPCGNVGCLEVLASGTSIARRFREALDALPDAPNERADQRGFTAADVAFAAGDGDVLASTVFLECARAVGFGVVNCIHIFNPDAVVLGGGVVQAGPLLFGPVRETVERYTLAVPRSAVRVERAELGDDAGLMGAALLALREGDSSQL